MNPFFRYHILGSLRFIKGYVELSGGKTPVVIYTMAKVGSMSIYRSVKNQLKRSVFHIHTMNQEKIDRAYDLCREKGLWPDAKSLGGLIFNRKVRKRKNVKIISLVRDPISRNVSAFFEVFRYHVGVDSAAFTGDMEMLRQPFLNKLNHDFPLLWFEEELKPTIGIDVYAQPFDTEKGYKIFQKENIDLLILRTDLADSEKALIVQTFLGIPDFRLVNFNVGAEKKYAALYQSFKEQLVLPTAYLNRMLDSTYCQHFYTHEEIQSFREKWGVKSGH